MLRTSYKYILVLEANKRVTCLDTLLLHSSKPEVNGSLKNQVREDLLLQTLESILKRLYDDFFQKKNQRSSITCNKAFCWK